MFNLDQCSRSGSCTTEKLVEGVDGEFHLRADVKPAFWVGLIEYPSLTMDSMCPKRVVFVDSSFAIAAEECSGHFLID
jgi:hypothetical protein